MTQHRADLEKRFVVERCVQLLGWNVCAKRAANLHGLYRPARCRATAVLLDHLAERNAEGFFHDAATLDIAGQLERERAFRTILAESGITFAAQANDVGYRCERNDIVDESRLAEQAFDCRQWRFVANDAFLSFQAFEHRGLFATNVGTGAEVHVDIKIEAAVLYVFAQPTRVACQVDGFQENLVREWIL